jgi:hypothetical protein
VVTGVPVLQAVYRYGAGEHARLFVQGSVATTAAAGTALTIELTSTGVNIGSVQATADGTGTAAFQTVLSADVALGQGVSAALGSSSSALMTVGTGPDTSGDGVPDWIRALAAGSPAATGSEFVALPSAVGNAVVTLDAGTHQLTNVHALTPPPGADSSAFPFGMFGFDVTGVAPGGSADVQITLPAGDQPSEYLKWDPTTGAITNFAFDGTTGATFDGNVITLHLVDGGRGDADGSANGVISDPGGPADPGTGNGNTALPSDAGANAGVVPLVMLVAPDQRRPAGWVGEPVGPGRSAAGAGPGDRLG